MKLAALSIIALAFIACNNSEPASPTTEQTTVAKSSQSSTPNTELKVSAYLVYEDGSLSPFDVLQNNDTIALWNTIIGEGSARQPSNNTKINLSGDLQDLNVLIKNGEQTAIDSTITKPGKEMNYVIKNTGCDEVYVTIRKNNKVLYNDTIPFQCGE